MPTPEAKMARIGAYGAIFIFIVFATAVETFWNATRHGQSFADRVEIREEIVVNRTFMIRQQNEIEAMKLEIQKIKATLDKLN